MESCKISIIVPVFNAKCTIERCLNSLVSQTYHNREIIVIDDGSSDGSGDIIDAFAKNTKDIQTIHTENRGVSAARNRGIKESSGDFLMFVDADDELTLDCLEMMVQHSEAVQLVACEAMNIYDDDISECNEQIQDISKYKEIYYIGENVFIEYFRKSGFACSLCTKLYRKELFKNITIPESIKYGEDARVMTRICDRCESMVYIPQKMYLRHLSSNSATAQLSLRNIIESVGVFDDRIEYFKEKSKVAVDFSVCQKLVCIQTFLTRIKTEQLSSKKEARHYLAKEYIRTLLEHKKQLISLSSMKWITKALLSPLFFCKTKEY